MKLTQDCLIEYPGYHGTKGICHVRIYEGHLWQRPVAVVGDFSGTPWTGVDNAAEAVAGEVQYQLLGGRRRFRFIEYRHLSAQSLGRFMEITFSDGEPRQLGQTLVTLGGRIAEEPTSCQGPRGRSRCPRVQGVNVVALLGHEPKRWAGADYTPINVASDQDAARALVAEVEQHNATAWADVDAREAEFFDD